MYSYDLVIEANRLGSVKINPYITALFCLNRVKVGIDCCLFAVIRTLS